ncbi:FMRFamide receptor-like [Saccostrea echinata]|uniref:FMRFamide receptor-like n=1 Tax=Saccostrea echinata TaxID=191078 RepID=UPI002A7ED356|nr:FMRFamide receptor-like [Saccostrea echinata]
MTTSITGLPNITEMAFNATTNEQSTSLLSEKTAESLKVTRLVVKQILIPIIATAGIIGNILNIIVLRNRKMRSSTNVYLSALAVCDMLYLIFTLTLSFIHCNTADQPKSAFHFVPRARVFSDLFGNTAVWLTVAFTIERYIGVCHPMRGKVWCTVGKAKILSVLVFGVSLVNTFPEFFEMEIVESFSNGTTSYSCEQTSFGKSESYSIGYYWWFVTFFTFVPFVFLFVFNSVLIKSVWKASKRRHQLSNFSVVGENSRQQSEQHKVTTMLITVVLIFLLCQLPWTVLLMYRTYLDANDLLKSQMTFILISGNICNLLVIMNASGNFLLYSYFSSRFRRTFAKVFCRWRKIHKTSRGSTSSTWKSSRYASSSTATTTSSCHSKRGTLSRSSKGLK